MFKDRLLEVLKKYVQIESGGSFTSNTSPSTQTQVEFAKVLVEDLKAIGAQDIKLDKDGYVYATLPATTDKKVPTIGFMAHMDTYPEGTIGRKVVPQLHKNYQGGDIVVSKERDVIITPFKAPLLKHCIGHDILTASGDTLLGADDKAGIAMIMVFAEHLIKHPEIKHGAIKIAFTPDEEIGNGPAKFDVKGYGADFAYTLDGECNEGVVAENFSAATVNISVKGVQSHIGYAKNIMVNPVRVLSDIIAAWPENKLPETTQDREGFIVFIDTKANFEKGEATAMVRNFDDNLLRQDIALLEAIVAEKRLKYPTTTIDFKVKFTYKNMKPMIDKNPLPMDLAIEALRQEGVNEIGVPMRGGTDGARLSFMGLPTPNLDAGYSLPHGPFEWCSIDQMQKIVNAMIRMIENNAK
ncbi:MAG: peptidase T [Elusimicrobiota bacterium]|jgi:tripeptide aminopeptidase|nr:peptidase T [Elusimicrobiota bacterium]